MMPKLMVAQMYVFSKSAHSSGIAFWYMFVYFVQVNDKPLICASANGNTKLVEHLLNYGANIDIKDGVTQYI